MSRAVSFLPLFGGGISFVGARTRHALARARSPRVAGAMAIEGAVAVIEPELPLADLGVRPVALEAVVRQDRSHVAIEVDPWLPGKRSCRKSEEDRGKNKAAE